VKYSFLPLLFISLLWPVIVYLLRQKFFIFFYFFNYRTFSQFFCGSIETGLFVSSDTYEGKAARI